MKVKLIPLSYAPISVAEEAFFLEKEEMDHICNLSDYKLEGGNYLSHTSYILNDPEMSRIKDIIYKYLNGYINDILQISDKFKIINSWTTRNPTNSVHHQHAHPNSILSGVYYVNAHSGDFLISTVPLFSKEFNFNYTIKEFNYVNSKSWNIPVRTGTLLIFPSWMNHQVTKNLHHEDRRILGFNAFLDLDNITLGRDDNFTKIK